MDQYEVLLAQMIQEGASKECIKDFIRETADDSPDYENIIFEKGVKAYTKKLFKKYGE